MTDVLIDRELLEQVASEFEHDNDRYMLGRELRKVLAAPAQPAAQEKVHCSECGLAVLDCDKRGCFGLEAAQDQRAIAELREECERLRKFEAAYNEWQDKTDWVQKTATTKELGKHRADILKDRLARWIERMNQPYDDADLDDEQQKGVR